MSRQPLGVYIGFDAREAAAFAVARYSIERRLAAPVRVHGIVLQQLQAQGLYTRPMHRSDSGQLWDDISEAPCSTEFAISRFFTPLLAGWQGWALFTDADVLVRGNVMRLFELADPTKAVMCVQHGHLPQAGVKMDGQAQLPYARKNWSSVMLFNCGHPANRALTLDLLNTAPGRDLHRFCWLNDSEIGALPASWNWLVGHSDPAIAPDLVHFTDGFPLMPGYHDQPYANEWRAAMEAWAGGRM